MFCVNCGSKLERTWGHCSNCGTKIDQGQKPQVPISDNPYKSAPLSGSSKRKLGCGTIVLVLLFLGAISSAFRSNDSQQSDEPPVSATPSESSEPKTPLSLEDAVLQGLGISLSDFAKSKCVITTSLDFEQAAKVMKEYEPKMKKVETARQALKFLQTVSLPATNFRSEFDGEFSKQVSQSVDEIEQKIDFEVYSKSGGNWEQNFATAISEQCPLDGDYLQVIKDLARLDGEANRIRTLSANVPWYPDGYSEYADGLTAWKWADRSCGYSTASCVHIDIVPKLGCQNLYVEVNVLDSSGSVIDWSNDTARAIKSGQVAKLEFVTFDDRASSANLVEINCY